MKVMTSDILKIFGHHVYIFFIDSRTLRIILFVELYRLR